MTTKARLFAKFERVFEPLTTDDIIKTICNYYSTIELEGFLEHCQDEHGVSDIDCDEEELNNNKDEE